MNKAVRKYLRQVKKHLYCPRSLKKVFLHQLEDELLLFCETQESAEYLQLVEQFGQPKEVAESFFMELDAKAVSRFAYTRLKFAYLILAVVLVAAVSAVTVSAVDYVETQQLVSGAHVAETFIHPDGTECTRFWVRTNFRGKDIYWEYSSCTGGMWMTIKPEEFDGTEPYAVDIYLNDNGTIEHWTFGQKHMAWIRVYDIEE